MLKSSLGVKLRHITQISVKYVQYLLLFHLFVCVVGISTLNQIFENNQNVNVVNHNHIIVIGYGKWDYIQVRCF